MIPRILKYSKKNSFFLFGPRGSGKSTWLKSEFNSENVMWFDLLEAKTDLDLRRDPDLILKRAEAATQRPKLIIIDEIQKIPALLDVVHKGIEDHQLQFILTGSSARKLRRGAANLLAGRAFDFYLFPFTSFELGGSFDLDQSLQYGLLPKIYSSSLEENLEKERYLYSYVSTYLKEEILSEQIVRKLEPFQKFLEVVAQSNGKIINYAKIARDAGIEAKQVERYFPILSDTLIGFFLEPYHKSIRKRQAQKSKFYFFDTGVVRALTGSVSLPLTSGTFEYGNMFESFLVMEFIKLNFYTEKRFKFSYFQTDENNEIDLIIEVPGGSHILVEIKSSQKVDRSEVAFFSKYKSEFKKPQMYYLSRDPTERKEGDVLCLPWQEGLRRIFFESSSKS